MLDHGAGRRTAVVGARRWRYHAPLDGLRGVAVLAVIAFHDGFGWARGGFLGVDAFFVLSGFLITTLLIEEHAADHAIALGRFWSRRARRLLPALLLVLVAVAAYTATNVAPYELARVRSDALSSLLYVTNWRFIATDHSYFALVSSASPVQHLWSLAIEEQFYLLWPLVALACLRVGRGRRTVLASVATAGAVASAAAMWMLFDSADVSRAYYGTDTRAHTILVGAVLAIALARRGSADAPPGRAVTAAGLAGAGGALWAMHAMSGESAAYYHGGSLAFALAIAAVIAACMHDGWFVARALTCRPLVWTGRISYGLYLWHWPINLYVTQARVGLTGAGLDAARLALTFALAAASYYAVELPIRRGALTGVAARVLAPATVALAGVALVASTAGALPVPTYLGGGQAAAMPAVAHPRVAPNLARRVIRAGSAARPGPALGPGAEVPIYPMACPPASDAERSRALQAAASSGAPAPAPPGGPIRVLVVGDSVACSLSVGLQPAGGNELDVRQAAVLGCGIVSGQIWDDEEPFPSGTDECGTLVHERIAAALAEFRPQVVLWISTFERFGLVDRGAVLRTGTSAWRHALQHRYDSMLSTLTADGARVVVATIASPAPTYVLNGGRVVDPRFDWRYTAVDEQLAAFVRRHPSRTSLVDAARALCPGGPPCPELVDGLTPRPFDGTHFDGKGAVWMSRLILPQILAAAHAEG